MKIIKIGNVELTEEEAERMFNEGKYIVTYSRIIKLIKRANRICGHVVYKSKGMTKRGRFYAMEASTVKKYWPNVTA